MKASAVGLIAIFSLVFFPLFVLAEEGTTNELVTTESSGAIDSVDVEDQDIVQVQPPSGSDMSVYGTQTEDFGQTFGIDSKGEDVGMYTPEDYKPEGQSQPAEETDPAAYPSYQY